MLNLRVATQSTKHNLLQYVTITNPYIIEFTKSSLAKLITTLIEYKNNFIRTKCRQIVLPRQGMIGPNFAGRSYTAIHLFLKLLEKNTLKSL